MDIFTAPDVYCQITFFQNGYSGFIMQPASLKISHLIGFEYYPQNI